MNEIKLKIWQVSLTFSTHEFECIKNLERDFAGALDKTHGNNSVHEFILQPAIIKSNFDEIPLELRHGNGSTGNKQYLDGTIFYSSSQNRYVKKIIEKKHGGVYYLDDSIVISHSKTTLIIGNILQRFLLSDLVEAFLLNYARNMNWIQCHAAAYLSGGIAYLIIGSSGYGKTTNLLKSIKKGAVYLGNDRVFIRLYEEEIQVRGYPISMNVGHGTIRSLNLNLPDFGGLDTDKIRLLPEEILEKFPVDYKKWWPVGGVLASSEKEIVNNLYLDQDPTHPIWNSAWNARICSSNYHKVKSKLFSLLANLREV